MNLKPAFVVLTAALVGADESERQNLISHTPIEIEVVNAEVPSRIQQDCYDQYQACLAEAQPQKENADKIRRKDLLECKTAKNKPECQKQSQQKFEQNVSPWISAVTACDTSYDSCDKSN